MDPRNPARLRRFGHEDDEKRGVVANRQRWLLARTPRQSSSSGRSASDSECGDPRDPCRDGCEGRSGASMAPRLRQPRLSTGSRRGNRLRLSRAHRQCGEEGHHCLDLGYRPARGAAGAAGAFAAVEIGAAAAVLAAGAACAALCRPVAGGGDAHGKPGHLAHAIGQSLVDDACAVVRSPWLFHAENLSLGGAHGSACPAWRGQPGLHGEADAWGAPSSVF